MSPDRAGAIRALRRAAAGPVQLGRRVALLAQARRPADGAGPSRGVAFAGTVWLGGDTEPTPGVLVVDGAGRMVDFRAASTGLPAILQGLPAIVQGLPADLPVLGGPGHWVVPGLVDAHVHLGFDPTAIPDPYGRFTVSGERTGLVGVRDLGAPMAWATQWRTGHRPARPGSPFVAVTGPILTAAGGY
ncbi:MAG TPA: hypothetical protein VH298_13450, partial [Jatrophihabitans sp.]|nr:hypothetical protein [Jatrophihabitans sp.]